MQVTRTRQSVGSQIREALDAMQAKGQIQAWRHVGRDPGIACYDIRDAYGREDSLTPGEAIDWVNAYGYGVRFGRA